MLTREQLIERQKFIGASDMPAILGLSPWATAEDVRLQKQGKVEPDKGNDATRAGDYLEDAIVRWAGDELGLKFAHGLWWKHTNGIMAAMPDGAAVEPDSIIGLEAKTSGVVGPICGNWGSAGTNEVPEMYVVQCQSQMACSKQCNRVYLAALLGGRGFQMYVIDRNDEIIAGLEQIAVKFWTENVLGDKPAPNSLASLDVLKRLKRTPGLITPIDGSAWAEYARVRQSAKEADALAEEHKRRVMNLVGQGDAISVDGQIVATYAANKNGVRSLKLKE